MKSKLKVILLGLIFSIQSLAQIEKGASVLGVSHPEALVLSGYLAYNYELWRSDPGAFWQYGFLRPKVNVDSSVFVNTINAELQFYPISIFGLTTGASHSVRRVNKLKEFDCDQYECRGDLKKTFIRAHMLLGYKGVKISYSYQRDFLKMSGFNQTAAVELNNSVLFNQGGSLVDKQTLFAGYGVTEQLDLGVLYLANDMKTTPNATIKEQSRSVGQFLAGQYRWLPFKIMAGLGTYESDYMPREFSALVKVSWSPDTTLSLGE